MKKGIVKKKKKKKKKGTGLVKVQDNGTQQTRKKRRDQGTSVKKEGLSSGCAPGARCESGERKERLTICGVLVCVVQPDTAICTNIKSVLLIIRVTTARHCITGKRTIGWTRNVPGIGLCVWWRQKVTGQKGSACKNGVPPPPHLAPLPRRCMCSCTVRAPRSF